MKSTFKTLILLSTLSLTSNVGASLVSLSFSDIAVDAASTFDHSDAGDIWRAFDARGDGSMDVIFTITGIVGGDGAPATNVGFVDEPARGNNMRVRVGGLLEEDFVTNASVFVTISFVNAGTTDAYTGWNVDETLITQFSDIDSDLGDDKSDFAGVRTGQFSNFYTSNAITSGSSLLNIIDGPAYAPDYTVAIMQTPWGDQGNVTSTDPGPQSPVTAAYLFNYRDSIDVVVGQRTNGPDSTRHIDIDMTPDFIIVPEPSTTILAGIMSMLMITRRRRA